MTFCLFLSEKDLSELDDLWELLKLEIHENEQVQYDIWLKLDFLGDGFLTGLLDILFMFNHFLTYVYFLKL